MIGIGERITQLRKTKNWSQDELAKKIGSSRVMVGKYERGDNSPSIEVIVKLAKTFDTSVDFLLGEGLNAAYDKEMIKRLDEVETLPEDEKQRIFHYMDLIIRDYKTKKAYNPQ
jgi:transcriptional regulator with XRE-family HTH domain